MTESKNQMGGDHIAKGEYYDRISEIITQDEAWDILISSDTFQEEYEDKMEEEYKSAEEIRSELEGQWMAENISTFDGFFLRSDGRVELRADA